MSHTNLPVSAARIAEDIDALAAITEPGRPWTRRAFGRFISKAGPISIDVSRPPVLNPYRSFRQPDRPARWREARIGPRSCSAPIPIPFPMAAGSMVSPVSWSHWKVARALADAGIALDHDLEIVDFLAEEVSIFGVSCIGSRGMAGVRPPRMARTRGRTASHLPKVWVWLARSTTVDPPRQDIKAFLELHIEQGTILESGNVDIGVVTAIAGIARIESSSKGGPIMPARRRWAPAGMRSQLPHISCSLSSNWPASRPAGRGTLRPRSASSPCSPTLPMSCHPTFACWSISAPEQRQDLDAFAASLDQLSIALSDRSAVTITSRRISDAPAVPMDSAIGTHVCRGGGKF